jgi:hypothetical protein
MEILCIGSLVEVVLVAILFKHFFTQTMRNLCRGAPLMVYVEHF